MTGRGGLRAKEKESSSTSTSAPAARGRAGRGNRGGGKGKGAAKRAPPDPAVQQDVVASRPPETELKSKQGSSGVALQLASNFFTMVTKTNWLIYQYHVDMKPDEEKTDVKKELLRHHHKSLGAYMFDGQGLYTVQKLSKNFITLCSLREKTNTKTTIYIKFVGELSPTDARHLQLYNIILRNALGIMKYEEMGRYFYDCQSAISLTTKRLELWPGVVTSIRNHENEVLLCVEMTHKVLRSDNVLQVIQQITQSSSSSSTDYKRMVQHELMSSIVMTIYNKKTYRIDDIKWDMSPSSTFNMKGGTVTKSYMDYYKEQYGVFIKDPKQPLLVSLPKKKDFHRGATGPIYLIPELCQMTGLSDQMRKDMSLMKEVSGHLSMTPTQRVDAINKFMEKWRKCSEVQQEMKRWGITFNKSIIDCPARIVSAEDIVIGPKNPNPEKTVVEKVVAGNWDNVFKTKPMLSAIPLKTWAMIVAQKSDQPAQELLKALQLMSKSLNFPISSPSVTLKANDNRPSTYVALINSLVEIYKSKLQMIMVILPNNNADVYGAIKRRCYVDLGIPSQCVVTRTLVAKNVISVAGRVAIQLNAKIGGEPWSINVPLKKLMVLGFDVYHSASNRQSSVGALVASLNDGCTKYFSTTSFHTNRNELSSNLCSDITKALYAFRMANAYFPARVFFYRDGVGDGQLTYIYNVELQQILEAMKGVYTRNQVEFPKFSFIIVTKRINTRIFAPSHQGYDNPGPGTIVDNIITLPERYDFFLISQSCPIGTVSPTSYNVLYDRQGLDPDKIQRLTYKMCHMYFNYTGTIAVPGPCQLAHKLAYVAGTALTKPTHPGMTNLLYYL